MRRVFTTAVVLCVLSAAALSQTIITESRYFLFRAQFFNLPNHVSFSPPARNISTPGTFGAITDVAVGARTIEMALKFYF